MNNLKFNIQKNKELCLEIFGNETFKECGLAFKISHVKNTSSSKGSLELLPLFFEKLSKMERKEIKEEEKSVVEK